MHTMDPANIDGTITLICGIGLVIGLFGIFVPVLPGLILCWFSVAAWAVFAADGTGRWFVLGIATAIAFVGTVIKFAIPGKRLKAAGVPNRSLFFGGLLGLVGFFVIPVVGLVLGFILGIYLSEHARLRTSSAAWASTKHALKAAGLATLIELAAGLAVAATWVAGLALL
jgi:uncharacterized protein YqgC (DUF456 family)